MKYLLVSILFFLISLKCSSQAEQLKKLDSLYREDQFYAGVTYNLLDNKPEGIDQNGLSFGVNLGFIKDMPISKKRNVALALGLGYSTNSFNQNLLLRKSNNIVDFSVLDDQNAYTKNKISTHLIEVPFEFRWRNSTPESYSFWRIYTGFKLGYIFNHKVKHVGDMGNYKLSNIDELNKFQFGITMSLGYNTWNLHLYYPLNPMFSNEAILNGKVIDIRTVKIGLMFYIL